MNGADVLCDVLLANDVNVCFANPGTSEMHFVAALDRKPSMRCVLGLFEGVVTGAADGYARMTDRPAATLLHTGPGLANGLANMHNARRAFSPMINIVGDHASYHLPLDAPLTSDIEGLAAPMSKWVRRIGGPADVQPATEAAFRASLTPPGVTTLILPADAAWGDADPVSPPGKVELAPPPAVDIDAVRAVATAIRAAPGRVGMIVRGRAARADALEIAGQISAACDVRLFSEVLIARMQRGRGRVAPTRIPYPVDAATAALRDIDVLVLVGGKEPVAFFAYPGKPGRLVRDDCQVLTLAAHGQDLHAALEALGDELGVRQSQPALVASAFPEEATPTGSLTEDAIALSVAKKLPGDAIVCDEAVTSARRFFALSAFAAPHDYMMGTGGSIGGGIPLATGAAIACPGRKVINLEADGSGMYTVQGLWTQAREKLDVVTIVFSNRTYAILHGEMRNVGVNAIGENARRMLDLDHPALDWVSLAKGMGVEAARADTCERFDALLDAALSRRGPFLIEAII
ncbi:acetolactate synthase large subunit [Mesorhizobium sp. B2-4-13]|uniref:acetolactate synthase large subunit n=1 Tax=Mesorhizobium sp. B2-4-13 TaxID=2589936 RepID=UPI0011544826|nr:acetolactate synthase large subunit [Mesorhizobium sp. B2-4-13]TPK83303.1 acetolactate synthase large subunit [Mesorhizobium sp. B2-4-13]